MAVAVPRDIKEMSIMVLADRKMQGFTHPELLEMREWMREAAAADIGAFRAYLDRECQPIRARQAMVDAWRMGRKDVKAELEANFVQSGAEIAEQEKVFIRGGLVGCRLAAFKKFIERLLK